METKNDSEPQAERGEASALEILSTIRHFYVDGKLSPQRLEKAAENIAARAEQDPLHEVGTSFEELFGETEQVS